MRATVLLAAFVSLFLVAGVCETVPHRGWEPGDYHPTETNKPYNLPAGLELRTCVGYFDEDTLVSLLPLALTVLNPTTARINTVFPAGLVFEPVNTEYQYMITLQTYSLTVPANQDTTVLLPTFCCNEMLDEPDDEANYTIHSQEWEVEMNELLDILKGKQPVSGYLNLDLVQEALFEITDSDSGLTDTMRTQLGNLP
jgi:hypothetical protein